MAGSTTYWDTRGAAVVDEGSTTYFDIRGAGISSTGSTTFFDIRGSEIYDSAGIRGPQIEPYDLELDRLVNITSASLAIVDDIDLTSIATTPLFTATQKTYVLGVILRITTADTVTVVAEASIGVNPSTNDMFANEQLVNFDAVDDLYAFWNNSNTGIILNTAEQLDLSVNTGATATSLIAVAYVIGVQL
jgi:hypothetical protein